MRLRSLLLRWLLLPLALLWAAGVRLHYVRSVERVNEAYDRTLLGAALAIAERATTRDGALVVDLPYAALEMLDTPAQDRVYYRVWSLTDPSMSSGYDDLPPPAPLPGADAPAFHDARYLDAAIRAVTLRKPVYEGTDGPLLVEVAETRGARAAMARQSLIDAAATQLALIAAAALAIVVGVRRGLSPLARLRARLAARRPDDLEPIDAREVPREVAPLIEAINLHTERQRRLHATQREFVADASHQLKTPLTVLKTQAALALDHDDPAAMRRIVAEIHASTDTTARVIEQLLALARSDEDAPAAHAIVDLAGIARGATFDLLPQALQAGVDLGYDGDAPAPVLGDRLRLRELVTNLADNAIRYGGAGAHVTVSVQPPRGGEGALLLVDDDGPGIPPAHRERVFERFYRVAGSTADGCGLGLAIVRQIATGHRASIAIEDPPAGRGTRFRVGFPAPPREAGERRSTPGAGAASGDDERG